MAGWIPLSLLGFLGTVVLAGKDRRRSAKKAAQYGLWIVALGAFLSLGVATGCGGYGNNSMTNGRGQTVNVMVTGTSGGITHTSIIALTIQ